MTALLRKEGQRSLAYGNQRIRFEKLPGGKLREVDKQVGLIFTADMGGRIGYLIQANRPMGTRAQKMCVADRWHDVRLYDARRPGIPREALLPGMAKAGMARCNRLVAKNKVAKGSCGFHNTVLQRASGVGERVLLQGQAVKWHPDGTYKPDGILVTVTTILPGNGTDPDGRRTPDRDGRGAIQYSALPEGATILGSVFTGGAYTATALKLLSEDHGKTRLVGALNGR